jgi:hypothetical protein
MLPPRHWISKPKLQSMWVIRGKKLKSMVDKEIDFFFDN